MTRKRIALGVAAGLLGLGVLAAIPLGWASYQVGQALTVDPASTANRDVVRAHVAEVLGLPDGQPLLTEYGELKSAYSSDMQAGGLLTAAEIDGLPWQPHRAGAFYDFGLDPAKTFPHLDLPDLTEADAVSEHWDGDTVIRVFRLPDGRGLMTYVST
jgi:hypothetical protein